MTTVTSGPTGVVVTSGPTGSVVATPTPAVAVQDDRTAIAVAVPTQGPPGPAGAVGPTGPQGPPGPPGDGGDLAYTHEQLVPSTTWSVTHSLGKFPSVTVVDSGGTVVIGGVTYLDADRLTITFSAAFGGRAYVN